MKKSKKIVALLLVGAMMISALSACGGSKANKSKAGKSVTINYYGRPDDNAVESTIVAAFTAKNPDIKINYVELPDSSNDRLKTINTVLQANDSSIDVFAGDVVWPPIFASAGWVIPFDEYLEPSETDKYLAGPLSGFQMKGKTYGLPFMADTGALYYRDDLLKKYGKEVPKTWTELVETSKFIMAKEKNPKLKGFVTAWSQNESLTSSFLEFYWAEGGEVVDAAGKSLLDVKKVEKALTAMYDMLYNNKVAAVGMHTFGTKELRSTVTAGNAIFSRDWLSGYAPYNNPESSSVAGKIKIAGLPSGGTLGGWGVMVSSFSKNKEAAVRFAKFRANYESQLTAFDLVKIVPTISKAFEDKDLIAKAGYLTEFLPVLETSKPRALTPFYAELSGIIQLEGSGVVSNMKKSREAAASIVEKAKALLG